MNALISSAVDNGAEPGGQIEASSSPLSPRHERTDIAGRDGTSGNPQEGDRPGNRSGVPRGDQGWSVGAGIQQPADELGSVPSLVRSELHDVPGPEPRRLWRLPEYGEGPTTQPRRGYREPTGKIPAMAAASVAVAEKACSPRTGGPRSGHLGGCFT